MGQKLIERKTDRKAERKGAPPASEAGNSFCSVKPCSRARRISPVLDTPGKTGTPQSANSASNLSETAGVTIKSEPASSACLRVSYVDIYVCPRRENVDRRLCELSTETTDVLRVRKVLYHAVHAVELYGFWECPRILETYSYRCGVATVWAVLEYRLSAVTWALGVRYVTALTRVASCEG